MELTDELYLYFTGSHVTSDFIVDCLGDFLYSTGYNFFGFILAGIVFPAFSGYLCMTGLKKIRLCRCRL